MNLLFYSKAWDDYLHWQQTDKKVVRKINDLLKEISRTPYEGTGKPEALKHDYTGYWSRRITDEHRVIYRVDGTTVNIVQMRYHYK